MRLAVPPLFLAGSMVFLYYLIDQLNPTSKEKKAARKKVGRRFSFSLLDSLLHLFVRLKLAGFRAFSALLVVRY
ncbi:unnamed protein product [Hydatigera taeniaeformis]|uniref:Uncharacterized protein n=1 Tax=Hydatigena taeniaeformis TaxID=6205 RepID=A0A3P7F1N2_HYDTA|nr:unnamed protein product [Hydatigera taeniaeformis]